MLGHFLNSFAHSPFYYLYRAASILFAFFFLQHRSLITLQAYIFQEMIHTFIVLCSMINEWMRKEIKRWIKKQKKKMIHVWSMRANKYHSTAMKENQIAKVEYQQSTFTQKLTASLASFQWYNVAWLEHFFVLCEYFYEWLT